jgi:hypothetical protein
MRTWESSEIPETSKLNFRSQKTLHWGVFYIIGKLSKCRCRTWARMSHLDIYSTCYGKKKGRESNWQFDSWPLKVKNRPDLGACRWSRYTVGKLSRRATSFFRPHPNRRSEQRVMTSQSPKSPNWDSFGTPPWESWDKKSFECRCHRKTQEILYGGRWWLPPNPGRGESCESKVARSLS